MFVFGFQGLPGTNGLPGGVGPQGPAVSICLIAQITLPVILSVWLYPSILNEIVKQLLLSLLSHWMLDLIPSWQQKTTLQSYYSVSLMQT